MKRCYEVLGDVDVTIELGNVRAESEEEVIKKIKGLTGVDEGDDGDILEIDTGTIVSIWAQEIKEEEDEN